MDPERAKIIADLSIRHYIIRNRILEIKKNIKFCTESNSDVHYDLFGSPEEVYKDPCYIRWYRGLNGSNNDPIDDISDMCSNCREWINTKERINRISREGASIKRRLTWKIKQEIKRNKDSEFPFSYETTEDIFDLIT